MKKILFLVFTAIMSLSVYGSHVAGGEITYEFAGSASNPYRYKITLTLVKDTRSVVAAPSMGNLDYTSSCFSGGSKNLQKIQGPGPDGSFYINSTAYECVDIIDSTIYVLHKYQDFIDLPGKCNDWKFSYSMCCRNAAISNLVNPDSKYFYLEAFLNNNNSPNNSPVFIDPLSKAFCINVPNPINWFQRATDPDGDSLYYSFGHPKENVNTQISFETGYSVNQPITSNPPVTISGRTGLINLKPTQIEEDLVKIKVEEYRFDSILQFYIKVGEVNREFQVPIVQTCSSKILNWELTASNDSIVKEFTAECGDSILTIYSSVDYAPSSIAANGSDFVLYHNNTLVPIISARALQNSTSREIEIKLFDTISFNDTVYLANVVGSDFNTLLNDCGFEMAPGDSLIVVFQNCSGIGHFEDVNLNTKVYPNPTGDNLTIDLGDFGLYTKFSLTGLNGQLLKTNPIDPRSKQLLIDMSALPAGIYLLKIEGSDSSDIHKILKY